MSQPTAVPRSRAARPGAEDTDRFAGLKSLALDALLPLALYYLLSGACGLGTVPALAWSSTVPALRMLWGVLRDHRLNAFAGLILAVNAAGLLMATMTGDARLMLAKDSGVSSVVGIGVLVSVAYGQPLMTTAIRPWITRGRTERCAAWETLAATSPAFVRAERRFSLVWGAALLAECVVRVVGAYTLPVHTMVWLGSVILGAAVVGAFVVSGRLAVGPLERMIEDELRRPAGPRRPAPLDAAGRTGAPLAAGSREIVV
jgi:hypothetical protein